MHAQDDNAQPVEGRGEETTAAIIQSSHRKELSTHLPVCLPSRVPIDKVSSVSVSGRCARTVYNLRLATSAVSNLANEFIFLLAYTFVFKICHVITARTH